MIEDQLKKWIKEVIESEEFHIDYFRNALNNDRDAINLWNEFAMWHRHELRDSVRLQIRNILKHGEKRKTNWQNENVHLR